MKPLAPGDRVAMLMGGGGVWACVVGVDLVGAEGGGRTRTLLPPWAHKATPSHIYASSVKLSYLSPESEGITWVRGWEDGEALRALLAAAVLE